MGNGVLIKRDIPAKYHRVSELLTTAPQTVGTLSRCGVFTQMVSPSLNIADRVLGCVVLGLHDVAHHRELAALVLHRVL